jgi:hypothetical protein
VVNLYVCKCTQQEMARQVKRGWWWESRKQLGRSSLGGRQASYMYSGSSLFHLTSHSSTLSHLLSRPTPTPSRPDAHRARAISAHSLPSPTIRSVTSLLASQSLTRRLCSQHLIDCSNTVYQHSTSPARHTAPSLPSSVSSPRLIRWHKQTDRWRLGSSSRLWGKLVPDMLMQGEIHPRHFIPCPASSNSFPSLNHRGRLCNTVNRLLSVSLHPQPYYRASYHSMGTLPWPSSAIHARHGLCCFGSAGSEWW